ncbi:MAG: DnaJ C-terminal domain-containing protein, partial [Acidobacteriota bacterium]
RVKVPAGSSSGRKIRLRGKGFPDPKGRQGDLYLEIKVMVPDTLSDDERSLFEQLAETSSFKPS